jgi:hypothetical protein
MTHVAFDAEREVMVVASLTYPITCSFRGLFDFLDWLLLSRFLEFERRLHSFLLRF